MTRYAACKRTGGGRYGKAKIPRVSWNVCDGDAKEQLQASSETGDMAWHGGQAAIGTRVPYRYDKSLMHVGAIVCMLMQHVGDGDCRS